MLTDWPKTQAIVDLTFILLFNLKDDNHEDATHFFNLILDQSSQSTSGKLELFARVTVKGKKANIGPKRKVFATNWDTKAKTIVGKSTEAKQIKIIWIQSVPDFMKAIRTQIQKRADCDPISQGQV